MKTSDLCAIVLSNTSHKSSESLEYIIEFCVESLPITSFTAKILCKSNHQVKLVTQCSISKQEDLTKVTTFMAREKKAGKYIKVPIYQAANIGNDCKRNIKNE